MQNLKLCTHLLFLAFGFSSAFPASVLKTSAQLKEVCDSFENSKWMNEKCYYFHNEEVQSFDDVQTICVDKFKQQGFDNGKLYEPRTTESFQMVYKLAEKFSNRQTLTIWLGMDDKNNEGEFTYSSDGTLPTLTTPWAAGQPNGEIEENCLTTFRPGWPTDSTTPMWYDRPCFENDNTGDTGHKFMCECEVAEEKALVAEQKAQDKDSGLWKPDGGAGECGLGHNLAHIVNGRNARFGELPWMAILGYNPPGFEASEIFYVCGGSLINKHYVLTAAHCINTKNGPPVEVVLGEHKVGPDPDCSNGRNKQCNPPKITRKIDIDKDVIIHENFRSPKPLSNDIALIRIDEAIPLFSENPTISAASPICLPWSEKLEFAWNLQDSEPSPNDPSRYSTRVAGWGRVIPRETTFSKQRLLEDRVNKVTLQVVGVPIAFDKCNTEAAIDKLGKIDEKTQICAGGDPGRDSCNGDSGGSLFTREFAGEPWYQIGIVSFGTTTCAQDLPGVYTRVTNYLPWIRSKLKP